MGTNRTQPFGYKMEYGQVVIDPLEARWVTLIYEQYIRGDSFQRLTEMMWNTGLCYDAQKQWNKNMIARILQDCRYTGDGYFPQIIEMPLFQRAIEKRSKKATSIYPQPVQMLLRRKCNVKVTPRIEHEVIDLLNMLTDHPERVKTPELQEKPDQRLQALEKELDRVLEELPVNEVRAKELAMQVAVAGYESISSNEFETIRIQRILLQETPQPELNERMIKQIVSSVQVDHKGTVKIRLKNGQIVEKGRMR